MLTVRAVAHQLNCSEQTVRTLIRSDRLRASRRLGTPRGAWQISEDDLEAFIEAAGAVRGSVA